MDGYDVTKQTLVRSLEDAGLDTQHVQTFLILHQQHKQQEQLQILYQQRGKLLEKMHANQKQMECLDYLVYILKKQGKN